MVTTVDMGHRRPIVNFFEPDGQELQCSYITVYPPSHGNPSVPRYTNYPQAPPAGFQARNGTHPGYGPPSNQPTNPVGYGHDQGNGWNYPHQAPVQGGYTGSYAPGSPPASYAPPPAQGGHDGRAYSSSPPTIPSSPPMEQAYHLQRFDSLNQTQSVYHQPLNPAQRSYTDPAGGGAP